MYWQFAITTPDVQKWCSVC